MKVNDIYRASQPVIHNAPHYGKLGRGYSNASHQPTASLYGGLASPDGHHSKTINHRSPIVGHGFASVEQKPMDLQEIREKR